MVYILLFISIVNAKLPNDVRWVVESDELVTIVSNHQLQPCNHR